MFTCTYENAKESGILKLVKANHEINTTELLKDIRLYVTEFLQLLKECILSEKLQTTKSYKVVRKPISNRATCICS